MTFTDFDLYNPTTTLIAVDGIRGEVGESVWKKAYPRRIATPQNYARAELPALVSLAALMSDQTKTDRCVMHMAALATMVAQYRSPMWFVSEALTLAILQSDIDDTIQIKDLVFPMPAFTLMFPMTPKTYEAMGERHIGYIQCAWVKQGYRWRSGPLSTNSILMEAGTDRMFVSASIRYKDFPIMDVTAESPPDRMIKDLVNLECAASPEFAEVVPSKYIDPQLDIDNAKLYFRLLISTIAVMNSRPDLVETFDKPERPERKDHKGRVTRSELWAANKVGDKFKLKMEQTGAHHASPRFHWRRGHFRQQAHGPARSLRKMIWLEPVMVNL